jgi:hypothetical protein
MLLGTRLLLLLDVTAYMLTQLLHVNDCTSHIMTVLVLLHEGIT